MGIPRCEVNAKSPHNSFIFVHDCLTYLSVRPGDPPIPNPAERRVLPLDIPGRSGWVWIGEPGATIHPSIDCSRCGTHGFWTDGEWRPV